MPARKVIRTDVPPEGLIYVRDLITPQEEEELLQILQSLSYNEVVMQGVAARRTAIHFGFDYVYSSYRIQPTGAFPPWLADIRDRAAPLAGLDPGSIEQSLIARYPAGAGIGWHRDAPQFGPIVCGISIGSEETMRFRRTVGDHFEMYKQLLAPRSLYVLSGASRSTWQHSLPPAKEQRYSITFRTVRDKYKGSRAADERPAVHEQA